ncbi:hypothetical protein LguiA_022105 [Lonicera macranthoides]
MEKYASASSLPAPEGTLLLQASPHNSNDILRSPEIAPTVIEAPCIFSPSNGDNLGQNSLQNNPSGLPPLHYDGSIAFMGDLQANLDGHVLQQQSKEACSNTTFEVPQNHPQSTLDSPHPPPPLPTGLTAFHQQHTVLSSGPTLQSIVQAPEQVLSSATAENISKNISDGHVFDSFVPDSFDPPHKLADHDKGTTNKDTSTTSPSTALITPSTNHPSVANFGLMMNNVPPTNDTRISAFPSPMCVTLLQDRGSSIPNSSFPKHSTSQHSNHGTDHDSSSVAKATNFSDSEYLPLP